MATALKSKSFQRNLLLSIGGVFLLFAICFSVYPVSYTHLTLPTKA